MVAPAAKTPSFAPPKAPVAPVAPVAKLPTAPVAPASKAPVAPVAPKSGTARTGKGESKRYSRSALSPDQVNLVPVMEEEFQHAITHGKAHVFEKWVGLQTRNRIINGVQVEDELEETLSAMFKTGKKIA